jgi:fructokinase
MLDVVCLGELLVDFVPSVSGQPIASALSVALKPGGAPANVAVASRKLGLRSGFIGKVGDDPFGRMLRQVLANQKVDLSLFLHTRDFQTRLAFVTNDPDERQRFLFYGNPSADSQLREKDIRTGYLRDTKVLHFGSISLIQEPCRTATLKAVKVARQFGKIVTFDPNLRPALWPNLRRAKREILQAIKFCQVLKMSDSEWDFVFPGCKIQTAFPLLRRLGVHLLAVTRGEGGAVLTNLTEIIEFPSLPVKVVDTTGAGDGFMAGLIHGVLRHGGTRLSKEQLREVGELATAVGSLTCTKAGAIPAFPSLRKVMQTIRRYA